LIAFGLMVGTGIAYWQSIAALIVAGVGVSMVLPVAPAAVMSAVAPSDMGRASGVNTMLQRFGSAFGVAVATAVFSASGSLSSAASFVDGLHPALATVAGLSVLGAITALGVARTSVVRSAGRLAREVAVGASVA